MTMVLAMGAAALVGGEQAEKSCAETLISLPYTSMSCACEELLDKKKKSPCTQSGDRSGLSGEDEIIYKLWFNVPVSSFFPIAATSPPSVTVV